jgi:flagellar biosynthesis anti-sigma factor FlgM
MKITPKGAGDTDLSQPVQNDKKVGRGRQENDAASKPAGESSTVRISPEARRLQRVAELARRGDELRGEKVKALKQKIDAGNYNVDAEEVAKSIARSEISRVLEKK